MEKRVEEIHRELIAFYPVYTANGNMTRVMYRVDGHGQKESGIDPRQVESVKRALARCYAVDLAAQSTLLREKYQRRNVLHFYLPDGRVFIPFKLRESRVSGDACYGYVDIDQVARLVPGDDPYVKLKTGDQLPLYSNITTARLSYFIGLEIAADCSSPHEEADLDLLDALAVLKRVFSAEPTPVRKRTRRLRFFTSK